MAEAEAAAVLNPEEEQDEAPEPPPTADAPEEPAPAAGVEPADSHETLPDATDHKRKLEDLEPREEEEEAPAKKQGISAEAAPTEAHEISAPPATGDAEAPLSEVAPAEEVKQDGEFSEAGEEKVTAELQHPNGETNGLAADGGSEVQKSEALHVGNGKLFSIENAQPTPMDDVQIQNSSPVSGKQPTSELLEMCRKIEVPNNKVGVLIGKSGETIRLLQHNSGARIQIMRDVEADPNSSTRPVELTGKLENISKAEKLIKDVIAEADAGGSPALAAKGFGTLQPGGEQLEIHVPNEKVGLIIGKGGETIKSLQTNSGARIQLIPQHLPAGDSSKERMVRISGNKNQIDAATDMIHAVMNQVPGRPLPFSGGYSQQSFRPRAPTAQPQWGPRGSTPMQQPMGYEHQQRGTYPLQTSQYPPQPYGGGYSQQPPPRSSFSSAGWDQRPVQGPPQTGGYDYYGQGGQGTGTQSSTPAPVNYNYGQSQAPGYGHPTPYAQSATTHQTYGHGYNEPRYDNPAPTQQMYGQQPVSSQTGVYGQPPSALHAGYTQQQPFGKPVYGNVPAQEASQSYGPPRATQPGDQMYQGPAQSYGSSAPTQQSYPYGSSAPQTGTAYGQTYGPTSGTVDGYGQQPSSGYAQQGGYAQGGPPVAAYPQPGSQSGGYGQYPSSQPAYSDQPLQSNASYGYQGGSADAGYNNNFPSAGYNAPPPANNQPGYQQPTPNPSGYYDQSVPPQSGYGVPPGNAPIGYTKSLSPQPGYGGQYH